MEQPIDEIRNKIANPSNSTRSRRSNRSSTPDEPPRFTIDLSLPPEQRYADVCAAFKHEMTNITSLFDEVVGEQIPFVPIAVLRFLSKIFLRRVYDDEENDELKGISKIVGVDMYLLVAFNVLLDLFMGCSSGGAVVSAEVRLERESKMVHFRTLDWWMDKLRRIVVQLDFVLERDGPVIASSVTYAGFVGVLTGVRKDFSVSLNFRPNRLDDSKFWANWKYRWHLLMVLLGQRPSISTNLRQSLLPSLRNSSTGVSPALAQAEIEATLMRYPDAIKKFAGEAGKSLPITTTSCYLCFSNGKEMTVIEKDRISAKTRSSTSFIVVTNADEESEANNSTETKYNSIVKAAMQEIIEESKDRERCARENWSTMRAKKLDNKRRVNVHDCGTLESLMDTRDVVKLLMRYPTVNEGTHFACVLDPAEGNIRWCRRWMKPVSERWVREHS